MATDIEQFRQGIRDYHSGLIAHPVPKSICICFQTKVLTNMTNPTIEQQTTSSNLKEYSYSLSLEGEGTAAKTLRLVGNKKKVLELGCSVGTQSKVLRDELGCEVTGVELNPLAARQAETYCSKVVVGNLDLMDFEAEFPSQRFDVVLCADVLEHIYNPTALLRRIKNVIGPSGYVVASIPNVVHIALIFEMLQGKFDYRDKGLLDDSHIRFFTRSSLIRTFSDAGFKIDHLDRGLANAFQTEFTVSNCTQADRDILDYLRANNEECFTYHFIVKATPSDAPIEEIQRHNSEVELSNICMMVRGKEQRITQLEKQAAQLTSHVHWLENKPLIRLASGIKSFLRGKRAADITTKN